MVQENNEMEVKTLPCGCKVLLLSSCKTNVKLKPDKFLWDKNMMKVDF